MDKNELNVIIRKRDGKVFEGAAKSVSSLNDIGPFDILPKHTNFVAIIKERIEIIKTNDEHVKMTTNRGIVFVKQNQVEIYLEA